MPEYVIVWWDVVRIIHAARYICTRELLHSPPLLSYYHTPPTVSPYLRPSFSPFLFTILTPFSPTDLTARSLFHIHHHHQHSQIRHLTATYIVTRNVDSYSVSLDSFKQVLMSCMSAYPSILSATAPIPWPPNTLWETLVPPFTPKSLSNGSLEVSYPFSASPSLSLSLSLAFSLSSASLSLCSSSISSSILQFLQRTGGFAITADTLLMQNWS